MVDNQNHRHCLAQRK